MTQVQRKTELTPIPTIPTLPAANRLLLPFPAGFPQVFRDDLAAGLATRRRFGRAATALFAAGFEAVSVVVTDDGPAYVLERR